MSRRLEDLHPTFRPLADRLLLDGTSKGIDIRPGFTLRHSVEQAALYRRGRKTETIKTRLIVLRRGNLMAQWQAMLLERVGPQTGAKVTEALPGESAHQYGLAIDLVVFNTAGKPILEESPEYHEIGRIGKGIGLVWGGDWGWDWGHFEHADWREIAIEGIFPQ